MIVHEQETSSYQPSYHYQLDGRYELKTKGDAVPRRREFSVGTLSCVLYSGPLRITKSTHRRGRKRERFGEFQQLKPHGPPP